MKMLTVIYYYFLKWLSGGLLYILWLLACPYKLFFGLLFKKETMKNRFKRGDEISKGKSLWSKGPGLRILLGITVSSFRELLP